MSKRTRKYTRKNQSRVWVFSERRDPPDVTKLSRAIVAMALERARAEADARSEHEEGGQR